MQIWVFLNAYNFADSVIIAGYHVDAAAGDVDDDADVVHVDIVEAAVVDFESLFVFVAFLVDVALACFCCSCRLFFVVVSADAASAMIPGEPTSLKQPRNGEHLENKMRQHGNRRFRGRPIFAWENLYQ